MCICVCVCVASMCLGQGVRVTIVTFDNQRRYSGGDKEESGAHETFKL